MLTSIYVVDYVIDDLDDARKFYDRVFATEPTWIDPAMSPGRELKAMYYQMPGPVGHVTTIGFFEKTAELAHVENEGVQLLGIQCRGLDGEIDAMRERGVEFVGDEPQAYAVGRNLSTAAINGVSYSVAEHEPGGHEKAREMMFTADGSTDYGDASQGGLLDRVGTIAIAVHDLEEASENYRALLGVEPTVGFAAERTTERADLRALRFPAPGDGSGLREVELVAPSSAAPSTAAGVRVRDFLDAFGEGVYQIGFLAHDVSRLGEVFEERGLPILPDRESAAIGRGGFALETFHNVDFRFEQA